MFDSLLPDSLFDYNAIRALLLPLSFAITTAGFILAVIQSQEPKHLLEQLARATMVVALIGHFGQIGSELQKQVTAIVEQELHARPQDLPKKFVDKLLGAQEDENNDGFWEQLSKLPQAVFQGFLTAIVIFAAFAALILYFLAYLTQRLALEMAFAISPLLVSFLMVPALRSVGVQFLLQIAGVALWPLGWGISSLVSERLLEFTTQHRLLVEASFGSGASFAFRNLAGTLLLSGWLIASTIILPIFIQRAITSGAQLGSTLIPAAIRR